MTTLPSAAGTMAAWFVSKILRCCQQKTGSLSESLAVFRPFLTQGIRWNSSSLEPKKKQLRIDDIRWLCRTGKVHEVPHFFDQLLELPDRHLEYFVNSALYWFLYYDKIEEALEVKTLMEKHGISKNYSTYSSLAVLYSRCSQLGNMKDFFDEMARDGLTPRARHYSPFVDTAIEKGDVIGAFHSLNEMEQSAVVHERNTDIYTSLIRACAGQQNKQLTSKVMETFHVFRKYRDLLSNDTLEAIKLWFDSQVRPKWITSWSMASVTFHCQTCKQKLDTGEFSAAELEELKHPLANQLWKNHNTLLPVQCFTSAGNYIDYVRRGEQSNFPRSIEQFIKTTGHYDVVIDGLNVAYFRGFFDPRKVENVVVHFVRQNKRVLVVGSGPMKLNTTRKGGAQTPLGTLMDYLIDHDHCGVFCPKGSSVDDVYFLSAAMHCGPGTQLVSRDQFCNHISTMDPFMKAQFRRWQNLNQMVLVRFIGDHPVFAAKKKFDAAVQTTGDTWHFPSSNGNQWLCAKRAGTSPAAQTYADLM